MDVLILVNGELQPTPELLRASREASCVIATDGGARYCELLQRTPDILIGDFDSIDQSLLEKYTADGAEVLRFPARKNKTDLELTVDLAIERGFKDLYMAGMLGGRWDMSLSNIFLLARQKYTDVSFTLLGNNCTMHLLRPGSHTFEPEPGMRASLVPLSESVQGVTIDGLEYPLSNATLGFGSTHGISNITVRRTVSFELSSGVLLLIFSVADN